MQNARCTFGSDYYQRDISELLADEGDALKASLRSLRSIVQTLKADAEDESSRLPNLFENVSKYKARLYGLFALMLYYFENLQLLLL